MSKRARGVHDERFEYGVKYSELYEEIVIVDVREGYRGVIRASEIDAKYPLVRGAEELLDVLQRARDRSSGWSYRLQAEGGKKELTVSNGPHTLQISLYHPSDPVALAQRVPRLETKIRLLKEGYARKPILLILPCMIDVRLGRTSVSHPMGGSESRLPPLPEALLDRLDILCVGPTTPIHPKKLSRYRTVIDVTQRPLVVDVDARYRDLVDPSLLRHTCHISWITQPCYRPASSLQQVFWMVDQFADPDLTSELHASLQTDLPPSPPSSSSSSSTRVFGNIELEPRYVMEFSSPHSSDTQMVPLIAGEGSDTYLFINPFVVRGTPCKSTSLLWNLMFSFALTTLIP